MRKPLALLTLSFMLPLLNACAPQNPYAVAMMRGVQPCWNIIAGAPAVEIAIDMDRNGTIKKTEITDTYAYQNNPAYRAAADSAVRSLNHTQCHKPKLPPLDYDKWNRLELTFDPRKIL